MYRLLADNRIWAEWDPMVGSLQGIPSGEMMSTPPAGAVRTDRIQVATDIKSLVYSVSQRPDPIPHMGIRTPSSFM